MQDSLMPKTNIVVTCWNALDYTRVTLERLFTTVRGGYYLTVVDNASTDGTAKYLQNLEVPANCRKLTIVTNSKNEGNVGAVNQGYEVSRELNMHFTCLCNNDLYFQSGWLERLENAMIRNEKIGMLGPLRPAYGVKHYQGEPTYLKLKAMPEGYDWKEELKIFMGLAVEEFDKAAEKIVIANGGGLEVLSVPPDALSSCCVLVRNAAAEKVGWMADPQFDLYGSDDIDLTWSIASEGYDCAMLKDVYVHHFRSKSIKANGANQNKLLFDNNHRFFNKWHDTIIKFLQYEMERGVDLAEALSEDNEFWFLFRLNSNVGFWDGKSIVNERVNSKVEA